MKVKLLFWGMVAIIVIGLFISLFTLYNQGIKKDIEIARLEFNNFQLLRDTQEQTVLYLKQKEVTGKLRLQLDSLAGALRVKPKQIEKIIYRTITEKDTVVKEIPVFFNKTHWEISDTGKCFIWQGMAFLSDTTLKVIRTEFSYQNKTTEVYYRKRPRQFLFFKFGKWVNMRKDSTECGQINLREFNFAK